MEIRKIPKIEFMLAFEIEQKVEKTEQSFFRLGF